MTDALLSAGVERCRRRGYEVHHPEDGGEPPGVAEPAAAVDPPFGPPRALALEPLAEADPTTVLSRLWTNQEHDRGTVFLVPDERVAAAVESLLAEPVGAADGDADGRVFHAGPDRVPLAEGGYAAVPTGTDLVWRETNEPLPESFGEAEPGKSGDADGEPGDGERGTDDDSESPETASSAESTTRLELNADGEPLAVLAGVDALDCPPRERFPYCYERDADKRIRVRDYAGRPVETFGGVAAMRDGGFRPVPAPLVPEHMLAGDPTEWWEVVAVE
ncbi:hypothetical protein RYH80_13355 [Halobaculum sp. MBLA0147]|uniref:hypothetical protein n=1 Tax=Halobaculum sp. MBLA0147 TaxID=3079934 RepID=UPI0035241E7A